MSEIRYDRLHDTHVIIAPERLHRPDCTVEEPKPATHADDCPFCEGNESFTPPEIFALREPGGYADEPGWQTRVVPNLYKAVQIETPDRHHYGMFEYRDGFGAHEVIIDAPEHLTSIAQWKEGTFANWLKTLAVRVADLRREPRLAYISLFKNEGTNAGATQPHSHTQLIGLPLIPERQRGYYLRAWHYYQKHGIALLTDIVRQEAQSQERIVAEQDGFTAFCPYASAFPFEVIVAPDAPGIQIDRLEDAARNTLAGLLQKVAVRLQAQLGCFDFNVEIATPPLQPLGLPGEMMAQIDDVAPLWIRIMPRIYRMGGFELSTQTMVNPVLPEEAAKLLREGE